MKEFFSVVVPVKDRENLIGRCLDSIKAQTYRPIRLIVVDNNSTDATLSRIEEWAAVNREPDFQTVVLSETKPGACAARNRGLQEVTSDVVSFFDSDDTMRPDLAQTAMQTLRDNPNADIVAWKCQHHGLDGSCATLKYADSDLFFNHLIHSILRTHAYAVRTSFVRKCGAWNEDLPVWNDWELGIRLMKNHPKVICVPRVLADIFEQKVSITGTAFSKKAGQWEATLQSAIHQLEASEETKRALRWVLYRSAILAATYAREGRMDLATSLLKKTLSHTALAAPQRLVLRLAYAYTRRGGRGAYIFSRPIMNFLTPSLANIR